MKTVSIYSNLWGQSLLPGQSGRLICPVCQSLERSFVVSKLENGDLAWICHRASCGVTGRLGGWHSSPVAAPPRPLPPVPELQLTDERDQWGYQRDRVSGGFVRPIIGSEGPLGFQLRWYDFRKPKTKTYLTARRDCETMHWEVAFSKWLVIVEDIPSAKWVHLAGYSSVALLGTLFNPSRAAEIKSLGYERLLFALDPDAYRLSVKYAREWSAFFQTQALLLPDDPKDMSIASLEMALNAATGDNIGTKTAGSALPPSTL